MSPEDIARYLQGLNHRETRRLLEAVETAVGGYRKPVVQIIDGGSGGTTNPPESFIESNPPRFIDVVLEHSGPDRLAVLRLMRKAGLGLRDAKAQLDVVPVRILEAVEIERARVLVTALEAVGAKARLEA